MPPAVAAQLENPATLPLGPKPPASVARKKKKKRKNISTPSDDSLPSEQHIRGDGLEQWRARAEHRLKLFREARSEADVLATDLAAARAMGADAEHAEALVNRGLITAKDVIAQRDRALAELNSAHSSLKAEHAKIVEEKRKIDKRLVILKTVSVNLHEAREARDVAERRAEDLGSANVKLRNERDELRNQVEAHNMVKQKLSKLESELDGVTQEKAQLEVGAKRKAGRAAGIGAAGAVVVTFALRMMVGATRN